MSIGVADSSPIPGRGPGGTRHHLLPKVGLFCLVFALLAYAGHRGTQTARRQLRLQEIGLVRDDLQQKLDGEPTPTQQPIARVQEIMGSMTPPSRPDRTATQLASTLKTLLAQFESDYPINQLPPAEDLERRLGRATLALAEQRFAEVLTLLTAADATKEKPDGSGTTPNHRLDVLQARADALHGLQRWREAADDYLTLRTLQTGDVRNTIRMAEALQALGRWRQARSAYGSAASLREARGHALLKGGKPEEALWHYEKALGLRGQLVEQETGTKAFLELASAHNHRAKAYLVLGKPGNAAPDFEKARGLLIDRTGPTEGPEPTRRLAVSLNGLGDAFLVQGQPGAAIGHYEKAIETLTVLAQFINEPTPSSDLATSHINLGNALLAQQNLDAAATHYEAAIGILTALPQAERSAGTAIDLAVTLNNRGVVHRARNDVEAALADFQRATESLEQRVGKPDSDQRRGASKFAEAQRPVAVRLDIALSYTDRAIDVLSRTRAGETGADQRSEVALVICLRNQGYARLARGETAAAIRDFETAVERSARLVGQEAQRDLAPQLAKSLSPLAWIYATSPDPAHRDGRKAKQYATRACQISEWKAFQAVETLAAACAESGEFAEAVKWQEQAIRSAPASRRGEFLARLELYRTGKPYRSANAPAGR